MDIRHLQLAKPPRKNDSGYLALRALLQVAYLLPYESEAFPRLHVLDEIPTTLLPISIIQDKSKPVVDVEDKKKLIVDALSLLEVA